MESLSRPSHRRKHSTATIGSSSSYSSFSFRGPYDDVLLSNGGKAKFEAHEYTEIFSGSSSIPVLELSGLNERVGSSGSRSPELDYSNIFGGFKGDDVAVPYEQLFSGALKKTKTQTRTPADMGSPFHDPGSVNSSRLTERPSGASDQSNDGLMQQFNMSFSKTGQRNNNESNGKTHIAQLHAVPGFTHFVDETSPHLQKKDYERPMKREVSRTWSFSSGAEPISVKGVIASEKSHIPDKSCNVNGINLKSHISKMPPPSSNLCNPNDSKDLRHSNLPSFASKDGSNLPSFSSKDDCIKSDGECSPPFLDEELDENSVEAVSAAALKKAIDQAQESIRIAKMIMEKRKEGLKDCSKPRSKSRSKVKGKKETGIHHVPDALKVNNVYGKCVPSLSLSLNVRKAKIETVRENVEAAIDHRDAFTEVGKKFAPSCIDTEMLTEEKAEVENVEASEAHGKRPNFTGLVTNEKCRAVTSDSGKIENTDYSTCSTNKVEPCMEQMETSKGTLEQSNLTVHQSKGPEIVSEIEESAVTSDSGKIDCIDHSTCSTNKVEPCMEQMETSKETLEQSELTVHQSKGLEIYSEIEESAVTSDSVKIDCIDHSTCSTNKVEPCMEQMETSKEILEQSELTVHQSKGPEIVSEIEESASNSSQSVFEALEQCQVTVDRIEGPESSAGRLGRLLNCSESVREQESDGNLTESNGVIDDKEKCKKEFAEYEGLVCMEKLTQLKFEFDNSQNGLIRAEKDVLKQPDLDKKPENVSEWKEKNQDGKGNDEIADTHRDSSEYGSTENMQMETDNFSDIVKSEIPWDVDEVNYTHRGSGRSEENQDKFEFQVVASEKDVDEVIDAHCSESDGIFTDSHIDNKGPIFSETQEPFDVDFNYRAEEYKATDRGCKGNDSLPLETETLSEVEDNGVASEEKFIESQPNSTFKGLSSDEEALPKAEKMVETDSEIRNAAEEYAGKINMINLPEFHTNDDKVTEVGSTVKPLLERTSENHEESLKVPTQQSQACRENLKDNISNTEDEKDSVVVTSDERKYAGEQVKMLHSKDQSGNLPSQSHCGEKEMEKSMKAERELGIGQKDAKGNDQKYETNERIEAIKRGREREKDKKAAERAIREARERAFAEARERAERAAVERAAAEARQRGTAEARDKHDKASVENKKPADKVSTEAKLRAERAAVERATTEARERALEKAMSQKTRTQTERFSSSSLNNGLKHSFSSSDLEKFDGANSESAQRCKARLESHQRIMERAAKALAEKNMRDVLAQKEQAERNRLAESLDTDIKRWATGKEGNLRALLSTLQYILGPDSGWQPVSLTEIITTAAVKKGYRKATLCVHPDKLQQRGATIQQKYICEKVFDLLKAAWNRFNSEER